MAKKKLLLTPIMVASKPVESDGAGAISMQSPDIVMRIIVSRADGKALKAEQVYKCAKQIERSLNAFKPLLDGGKKALAVFEDMSSNNKGFLGKLVLQDYQRYNELFLELPKAIKEAEA